MDAIVAISFLATLVSGCVVGGRLLWLAHRTRKLPELCLGISAAALSLGGLAQAGALRLAQADRPTAAFATEVLALGLHSASGIALYVGVWQIFHPGRNGAQIVATIGSVILATSWILSVLPGQHTSAARFPLSFHLHVGFEAAAFLWLAFESLRYQRALRKRLELGLSDRLTTWRFGAWAVAMACIGVTLSSAVFVNATRQVLLFETVLGSVVISVLGLVGAVTLWWAFLPPAFLKHRLASRASAPSR